MYQKDVVVIAGVFMLTGYCQGLSCYECVNHPVYGTGQGCGEQVTATSSQVTQISCNDYCMISKNFINGDYIYNRGCGCAQVSEEKSVVTCCKKPRCNASFQTASEVVADSSKSVHCRTSFIIISFTLISVALSQFRT